MLLVLLTAAGYLALRASLPRTAGEAPVAGLGDPVEITRDALGIPTVRATTLLDAFRGQGFVHAQDRYFQMDMTRRVVAGELAELVGSDAIPSDRRMRRFAYRARARALLGELPPEQLAALEAYTEGVNAGLADLAGWPPEYLALRRRPEAWRVEDSVLAGMLFFVALSSNPDFEKPLASLAAVLPAELVEFLTPDATRWDTPVITGDDLDRTGGYRPAPIPGPEVVDLRVSPPPRPARRVVQVYGNLPGSNNWAVAGTKTKHGGALVANDPHLSLGVPNIWHRVELRWDGGTARGAAMAGIPGVLIGSTDRLAWGFTNAAVDQADLVIVEVDPADAGRYRVPEGTEPFTVGLEEIRVRGQEPDTVHVRHTRWGPVVDTDWRGRPLALRSVAWDHRGLDFEILQLLQARSVDEGVEVMRRWGAPALSFVAGDADGRVAFALAGRIPRRVGFDGKVPRSWADGEVGWAGTLPEERRPIRVDPADGFVFSANHRLVPLDRARELSRVWVSPTRARRIANVLGAGATVGERDLLALQLDTRSYEHDRLQRLVLEAVPAGETDPLLARAQRQAEIWNGRADADQPGFRLLQVFAQELREALLVPLLAAALAEDPQLTFNWPLAQETVYRILDERPEHLLPPPHEDWTGLLRSTLRSAAERIQNHPAAPGLDTPWGDVNRASIRHPFGMGEGLLARALNMRTDPLPGWVGTVRAQAPAYGASLRMVVDPARPDSGIFHMPGGQSGHLLSAHYRDGHQAWVEGRATPFTAGATRSTFRLVPAESPGR